MGRIPDEDIAAVRDATDLVALVSERVVLRQKGRLFWGCCPFHAEKTPSFKVDPATQLWHCFGCGLGGDAFGYLMRMENLEFLDAVRVLADRANIELHESEGGVPRGRKERLIAACEASAAFYHGSLTKARDQHSAAARAYLAGRGFGSDVAKRFRLGYAPGRGALVAELTRQGFSADEMTEANLAMRGHDGAMRDRFFERIMFPIHDLQGRCIAFGGRVLDKGEPKYLNTSETPVFSKGRNLYAIDRAKAGITSSGFAVVVEGYTDVIALHEAGITNAVATLGTSLTREHVKLLGRFARKVVYLFDGDEAGMRAADRAVEFIDRTLGPEAGQSQVELVVAVVPGGMDPADYVKSAGSDALRSAIDGAMPLLRFALDRRLSRYELDKPEQRVRALADAAQVLAPLKETILVHDYINYLADRLAVDFDTVQRVVRQAKPMPGNAEESAGGPDAVLAAQTPQVRAEREALARLVKSGKPQAGARFLLTENMLSDALSRRMAQALSELLPADERAIIDRLASAVPEAPDVLSAALVDLDAGGTGDDEALSEVVERLKELDLERRINEGKAALKRPDALKDQASYDELFKNVSALTRELDEWRRGVRKVCFDPTA